MPTDFIDLNADLGESFGAYSIGDDPAMLDIVSSANVACGFHGGDPEVMNNTIRLARERNVAVGAHPGFADLAGFGRRVIPCSVGEIERLIAYQLGAAMAMAAYAGHRISYLKPHGALANLTERDASVADAVLRGVRGVDANMPVLAIAHSHLERLGRERNVTVFSEIFADRGYTADGHLAPRAEPGAVLHDATEAAARAVRMVRNGVIETRGGALLPTRIDSICVHGDTPGSVAVARQVRDALAQAGIALRALG